MFNRELKKRIEQLEDDVKYLRGQMNNIDIVVGTVEKHGMIVRIMKTKR